MFLLLSLRTCSFKADIGLEETFEGPRASSGDEYQLFFVIAFAGLEEAMLLLARLVIDEELLAVSTGVGNAYVLNFRVRDERIRKSFSEGGIVRFSAKRGADWLSILTSLLQERDLP